MNKQDKDLIWSAWKVLGLQNKVSLKDFGFVGLQYEANRNIQTI